MVRTERQYQRYPQYARSEPSRLVRSLVLGVSSPILAALGSYGVVVLVSQALADCMAMSANENVGLILLLLELWVALSVGGVAAAVTAVFLTRGRWTSWLVPLFAMLVTMALFGLVGGLIGLESITPSPCGAGPSVAGTTG